MFLRLFSFYSGMLKQPMRYAILIIGGDHTICAGFQYVGCVCYGIAFISLVKERKIVHCITKGHNFVAAKQCCKLTGCLGFCCCFRHNLKPLRAGVDILAVYAAEFFAVHCVQGEEPFRLIYAREIKRAFSVQIYIAVCRRIAGITRATCDKRCGFLIDLVMVVDETLPVVEAVNNRRNAAIQEIAENTIAFIIGKKVLREQFLRPIIDDECAVVNNQWNLRVQALGDFLCCLKGAGSRV